MCKESLCQAVPCGSIMFRREKNLKKIVGDVNDVATTSTL